MLTSSSSSSWWSVVCDNFYERNWINWNFFHSVLWKMLYVSEKRENVVVACLFTQSTEPEGKDFSIFSSCSLAESLIYVERQEQHQRINAEAKRIYCVMRKTPTRRACLSLIAPFMQFVLNWKYFPPLMPIFRCSFFLRLEWDISLLIAIFLFPNSEGSISTACTWKLPS